LPFALRDIGMNLMSGSEKDLIERRENASIQITMKAFQDFVQRQEF
jgi:hypothetical protein